MPALSLAKVATLSETDSLKEMGSAPEGLSVGEYEKRLLIYGSNTIKEEKKIHALVQFLNNFKNPLVIILLCVAAISFVLGDVVEGIIVVMMISLSVTLNFFQEYKAGNAAEKLKERVSSMVIVIRDGEKKEVKSSEIVPGDIVELNAGDLIPADARLISARDFFVNQASLTGESFPVEKHEKKLNERVTDLQEMINMVFCGTSVVTGSGMAVIINTGNNTEFGKIAEKLESAVDENEFTKGIGKFSYLLMKLIVFLVLIVFFTNALLKQNIIDSFIFAIAVAVGLTPEFLPMIMSVTMGKGSMRMAKKGVIVKKLTAIPTFGSMDILCTDKTGTLTQDKINLVKYTDIHGQQSEEVLFYAYLNSYFQTGITNPLNEAILGFKHLVISKWQKIDEIPFDFERKKMSVVAFDGKRAMMITKGAPEEILKSSHFYEDNGRFKKFTPEKEREFIKQYEDLSKAGFRVLGVAIKQVPHDKHPYKKEDEKEMVLIGFTSFLDPVKPGVKEAIDELEAMGIEMKVVSGDNELVGVKICEEAGINIKGVMLGNELASLNDDALAHKVEEITLFARFSPVEKNRIIQILRKNNHVVGYMGDGINDAPSLQSADVGISVNNAVDVAKESADIILTNKSLHELKDGVIEGRKTFGNTLKYIMMGASSNFGNMFSVLGAVIFLPFLPMLPIQILLNNFLYDFSQITIPSDVVDDDFIQKPKRWDMKFIKKFIFIFGPISSIFDFLTFFILYTLLHLPATMFQTGWFMESLATQALVIYVIRTRKIPFIQSKPSVLLMITTILAVSIGWLIPFTKLGGYFGFTPLPLKIMICLIALVLVYLVIVEIAKRYFYKHFGSMIETRR